MNYGFTPILNTDPSTGGLSLNFDALVGLPLFKRASTATMPIFFAAIPSLHAAYMLRNNNLCHNQSQKRFCIASFAVICMGIWFTAVYTVTTIIDVLLGASHCHRGDAGTGKRHIPYPPP